MRCVPLLAAILILTLFPGGALLARPALPEPAAQSTGAEAEAPDGVIAIESDDRRIGQRVRSLFGEIDELRTIRVTVRGGVVTLVGTTLDIESRARAEDLAGRVAGVVSVENELRVERNLHRRLEPLVAKSQAMAASALTLLPLLAVALLAFAVIWLAGRIFTSRTSLFRRVAPNPFIEALFEQVVRLIFIVVGIVVAMSILGATALIGTVLGAAGVLGLAVGFAVRDTIENYIASILLSIRQPFRPNDAVLIEGIEGRVTTLNSRATIITTWDGNEVRIPNAVVYKAKITNFTHTPERRFEFELRVSFDTDLSCALAVALRATSSVDGVLPQPAAAALLDRVEEFGVVLKILAWVDQSRSDYGKVRSETIRAVKEALEAEHISLAEPIQNVRRIEGGDRDDRQEGEARTPRQPTADEVTVIRDTSADTTIEQRVEERRSRTSNDLLTSSAPRE